MQPAQIMGTFTTKDGRPVLIRAIDLGDVEGLLNYINALIEEDAPISTNERQTYLSEVRFVADEIQRMLKGDLLSLV
ncbi:MAG: hypothetical protein RAK25_03975, partial [TACK group archaeon]|nr:hypothetical protein [TACK group archaeon]